MDWPDKLKMFHEDGLKWAVLARTIEYRSPGSLSRDIQRRLLRADEVWRIATLLQIDVDWLLDPRSSWPPKPESEISDRIATIRQRDFETCARQKRVARAAEEAAKRHHDESRPPRTASKSGRKRRRTG